MRLTVPKTYALQGQIDGGSDDGDYGLLVGVITGIVVLTLLSRLVTMTSSIVIVGAIGLLFLKLLLGFSWKGYVWLVGLIFVASVALTGYNWVSTEPYAYTLCLDLNTNPEGTNLASVIAHCSQFK